MKINNSTNENIGYAVCEQPVDCTRPPAPKQGEVAAGECATIDGLQTALCRVCLTPGSKPDWSNFTWVRRDVPQGAEVRFSAGESGERHIELATSNS